MALIRTQIRDAVGIIILNDPAGQNALGQRMAAEVIAALATFGTTALRAVILRAPAGTGVWSVGHAEAEVQAAAAAGTPWHDPVPDLVHAVHEAALPVIALVEGSAWGAACDLIAACDLVVATPAATFGPMHARQGRPLEAGSTLAQLAGAQLHAAKEMAYTARPIRAERAERLGLVNHVVPPAEIESCCLQLARDIAGQAPGGIAAMKAQLHGMAASPR